MAGHSHWAGIKHKKAANDAKKGKIFSRLAKLVYTAVKEGGSGNPDDNPRLRLILEKCRQANMPKDNVKRAIDKAGDSSAGFEAMTIEGYGPAGVAVICEALTDNTNRTGPELRHICDRQGVKVGKVGCVSHMFQRKGYFTVNETTTTEDALMDIALEAGAEDIVNQGGFYEITCDATGFVALGEALEKAGIATDEADIRLIPDNLVEVGLEDAQKLMRITERLEEHDDVQNVYTNFDVSEETAAALAAAAE